MVCQNWGIGWISFVQCQHKYGCLFSREEVQQCCHYSVTLRVKEIIRTLPAAECEFFAAVCDEIWSSRNSTLFDGKRRDSLLVVCFSSTYLATFKRGQCQWFTTVQALINNTLISTTFKSGQLWWVQNLHCKASLWYWDSNSWSCKLFHSWIV